MKFITYLLTIFLIGCNPLIAPKSSSDDIDFFYGDGTNNSNQSLAIINISPEGLVNDIIDNKVNIVVKTNMKASCHLDNFQSTGNNILLLNSENNIDHQLQVTIQEQSQYNYLITCETLNQGGARQTYLLSFSTPEIRDITPPEISIISPSGTLPSTTRSAQLRISTNENATCRYSESLVPYSAMTMGFDADNMRMMHSAVVATQAGKKYIYYVECQDIAGNSSLTPSILEFQIEAEGVQDKTPPVLSQLLPNQNLMPGSRSAILMVTTNENASCRWSVNSNSSFNQMSLMQVTGSFNHSQSVTNLTDGQSYSYYIKCQDSSQNISASSLISFSVSSLELDGERLYVSNCMNCHGALAVSNKINRTQEQIQNAIDFNAAMKDISYLKLLVPSQVQAIAKALYVEVAKNNPPVISADLTSVSLFEEALSSVKITGTDLDNDSLNYSFTNKPDFVETSVEGNILNIVLKPQKGDQGNYNFSIVAKDPSLDSSNIINVSIEVKKAVDANNLPVLSLNRESVNLEVGNQETLMATASDPDNDVITFNILSKPSFIQATQNGNNYTINLNPGQNDIGMFEIAVIATDAKGGVATRTFIINVNSAEISLDEQYAADFANISFRLADRQLVYSWLVSVFGDYAQTRSDVINIRRNRDIFGGGCDHFEQGLLPGSSRYSIIEEFPGYSCNRNHLPEYTTYKANFTTSSSPIRSALVIKACENILSERNYTPVIHALNNIGATVNSTPDAETINNVYRLFYRHRDIPKALSDSLINRRNDFDSSRDYWKSILLGLCTTPWWQEV